MSIDESIRSALPGTPSVASRVPRGPRLILKIGVDGDVYVNYRRVEVTAMVEAVRQVKQKGGYVIYYREGPMVEPSGEALAVFKQMVELKPMIQLGDKAPSEWGRLDWVELEEAPTVSRFFLARGSEMLISYPDLEARYFAKKVDARVATQLLGTLDLLVRADRILETPMHEPNLCLDPNAQLRASVHIRLAYGQKGWASHYAGGSVPRNVRSFQEDVSALAHQTVAALTQK